VPNYDGKENEPTGCPAKIPNLLINGSRVLRSGWRPYSAATTVGEVVDVLPGMLAKPISRSMS
jgi:DNA gyrase/topoisomerase IV subunit A